MNFNRIATLKVLLLSFIFTTLLMFMNFCVSARQEINLTVEEDEQTGQCLLRGNLTQFAGSTYVIKICKNSDDTSIYFNYDNILEDGAISHDFYIPDNTPGVYVITISGEEMQTPVEIYFDYQAKYSDSIPEIKVLDSDTANIMYDTEGVEFTVYGYQFQTDNALYSFTINDEKAGYSQTQNFTINGGEKTIQRLVFLGFDKGIHDITYVIEKDGETVCEGEKRIAIIEKYQQNYRQEDYSFGVNALMDNDEKANAKELEILSMAGVSKIRLGQALCWSKVEEQKGVYNVPSRTRLFIDKINENNMSLLVSGSFGNALYNDLKSTTMPPLTKAEIDAFCEYVKTVVKSLPQINRFEIWNEPDLTQFWNHDDEYAVEYAALVKAVSMAIKEVRPDITVIGGAVSSSSGGVNNGYILELMQQEIRPYVDAFSYHPYCNQQNVDEAYYEWPLTMQEHVTNTGGWLDFYNSEMGYAVGTQWGYYVDEDKQAEYLVKIYSYNAGFDVKETYWFTGRNSGNNPDELEQMYGLLENDFTPKPSYAAISQLNCRLSGGRYLGPVKLGGNLEGSMFDVNGEITAIIWSKNTNGENYNFGTSSFVMRDIYGNILDHTSTVRFTTTPVYISGLSKSFVSGSVKAKLNDIATKYGISSETWTIVNSYSWQSATANGVKNQINSLTTAAISCINKTTTDITKKAQQAEGFRKMTEIAANYYAYLYSDNKPVISYDSILEAGYAIDSKSAEYKTESMVFSNKMLKKSEEFMTRAVDILFGETEEEQNGFAAADLIVSDAVAQYAKAFSYIESPDNAFGLLAYTEPTQPIISRNSNGLLNITIQNKTGRRVTGKLTMRTESGVIVSPEYAFSLMDKDDSTFNVLLFTNNTMALGDNVFNVVVAEGNNTYIIKRIWINVTDETSSVIPVLACTGFTDENGATLAPNDICDTVNVGYYIDNISEQNVTIIIAFYKDSCLKKVECREIQITSDKKNYNIQVTGALTGTEIKAMVFDSFNKLRPLSNKVILK